MKCLLVIDMQEDYVGESRNKKRFSFNTKELIANVNKKIREYPKESVIYITNRFFWESNKRPKELADGLLIVSDNQFEKRSTNCFANKALKSYLAEIHAAELELVGVDGNYCVGASAYGAAHNHLKASLPLPAVGISDDKKFLKTRQKLEQAGVVITG